MAIFSCSMERSAAKPSVLALQVNSYGSNSVGSVELEINEQHFAIAISSCFVKCALVRLIPAAVAVTAAATIAAVAAGSVHTIAGARGDM